MLAVLRDWSAIPVAGSRPRVAARIHPCAALRIGLLGYRLIKGHGGWQIRGFAADVGAHGDYGRQVVIHGVLHGLQEGLGGDKQDGRIARDGASPFDVQMSLASFARSGGRSVGIVHHLRRISRQVELGPERRHIGKRRGVELVGPNYRDLLAGAVGPGGV